MGPISSPPHSGVPVAGVSAHWVLWCAGSLSVTACRILVPMALLGFCLGGDVPQGLGSLGPSLDLLQRRQLREEPVGSSLHLPLASALWLLGGSPGAILCSSLGWLR
ncbi:hypothetical protein AMECASPLE_033073 [Ameca splendens]|uniref:Uncharacterized protein n=1 Tax=Ameca splendens TaxID=208324 RepID=A0ABV0ZS00_9TELE